MSELVPLPAAPPRGDRHYEPLRTQMRQRMKRLLSVLSSVPQAEEEAAAFFQRRLKAFVGIQWGLWATMWVSNWLLNYRLYPTEGGGSELGPRPLAHLSVIVLLGVIWGALRRARQLDVLSLGDMFATLVPAAGLAVMTVLGDASYRSDLPVAIGLVHILVLRAALVPSPATRTILVGAIAQAMIVAATAVLFSSAQAAPELKNSKAAIQIGIWACIALVTTGAISHVIYRLRARITAAESFGQYVVTRKLGEGSSGIVYLAEHALLRRPTALKLLKQRDIGRQAAARFEHEARQLSRLSHPNIVALYDYGQTPEGQLYYAMEFTQGVDLETLVDREGPLPAARVVDLLKQAADALAEAHHVGLVHRDVKPGNLVLCPPTRTSEVLKLVDFGLAKDLGVHPRNATYTDPHAIIGTPYYMPPEAVSAPETVGPASDVYSLGAVGYFLLTGKPLFDAASAVEVLYHHVYSKVPPLTIDGARPQVSEALENLLRQCLEKDPAARPTSDRLTELLVGCEHGWPVAECRAWWARHGAELTENGSEPVALKLRMSLEARGIT